MSVCANDFFSQAKNSLDCHIGEISNRCSIKNSYYAAYYRVKELLTVDAIQYKNTGMHQSFIDYLMTDAHRYESNIEKMKLRRLGIYLSNLKSSRTQADYVLDEDISLNEAMVQMGISQNLFDLCKKIESERAA